MAKWRPAHLKRYESYDSPTTPNQGGQWFDTTNKPIDDIESFEQGADSMLTAIKKQAVILGEDAKKFSTTENWYLSMTNCKKGNWYFIPDDEVCNA